MDSGNTSAAEEVFKLLPSFVNRSPPPAPTRQLTVVEKLFQDYPPECFPQAFGLTRNVHEPRDPGTPPRNPLSQRSMTPVNDSFPVNYSLLMCAEVLGNVDQKIRAAQALLNEFWIAVTNLTSARLPHETTTGDDSMARIQDAVQNYGLVLADTQAFVGHLAQLLENIHVEDHEQLRYPESVAGTISARERASVWSDPFIDTPSPVALVPTYHPDFLGLDNPGYAHYALPVEKVRSRRVVVNNLPPDATLAQVLQGVCSYGGIISASIFGNAIYGNKTKTAILEFVYLHSAQQFVEYLDDHALYYMTRDGCPDYLAEAVLVPTHSYGHSMVNIQRLEQGMTRALVIKDFPVPWLWYFLSAVGLRNIVRVELCVKKGAEQDLIIELCSLHHAERVKWLVACRGFLFYTPGDTDVIFVNDSSQRELSQLFGNNNDLNIGHIPSNSLAQLYECSPYNYQWPTAYEPIMALEGLQPKPASPQVSNSTLALAELYGVDPDEVDDWIESRRTFVDEDYKIMGSTITLTRRKWGWNLSSEDEDKLLMANTLHEPEWADEWDAHFMAHGMVNLRTWERYGMVASHRKANVTGCVNCGMGCAGLKAAPVPKVIRDYLKRRTNATTLELDTMAK